jgi:glutathione-regulated potassium-efflux system ancillary protein KefC
MDFIWILFAFICGLGAKTISLPPSIGFLAAGFILNIAGYQADESLSWYYHYVVHHRLKA